MILLALAYYLTMGLVFYGGFFAYEREQRRQRMIAYLKGELDREAMVDEPWYWHAAAFVITILAWPLVLLLWVTRD